MLLPTVRPASWRLRLEGQVLHRQQFRGILAGRNLVSAWGGIGTLRAALVSSVLTVQHGVTLAIARQHVGGLLSGLDIISA